MTKALTIVLFVATTVILNALLYVNYNAFKSVDLIWPPRTFWFFTFAASCVLAEVLGRRFLR